MNKMTTYVATVQETPKRKIGQRNVTLKYTFDDGLINVAFFNYHNNDEYLGEITINEHDKTVYLSDNLQKQIIQTDKLNNKFFEPCADKWEKIR